MSDLKRHGKKWTTVEMLKLHREYELLQLSVPEIAKLHKRSLDSILYKLQAEGLISSLDEVNCRSFKNKKCDKGTTVKGTTVKGTTTDKYLENDTDTDADSSSDYSDNDEDEDDDYDEQDYEEEEMETQKKEHNMNNLSDRVWSLETNVQEIGSMVKQMFDNMTTQKKSRSSKNKSSM
jgi:ABC-type Zn2+ transport system substrate-binding protein/surface adhesin